ncbi:helix-turn-helix domain-containing protein [Ruania zhangjianzhongii]|uniref:helix-turn-helix domain-containing protein n=1 Tax=Ruania zhangjianzhongii TaxID=2603206 RepID=UPI0011CA373F|nr:AraC family transcriptional regulator [Ruania zhangjianzhongii]
MTGYLRDGFPGERIRVLPRPLLERALAGGLTGRLLVTDAGYFPHAANHGRRRRHGAREAVVLVCVAGRGRCQLGDSVVEVRPGQALVLAPGRAHLYWADAVDPWTLWWFHATGSDLDDLLTPIVDDDGHGLVPLHDPAPVVHAMEQVMQALERDETAPSLVSASGAAWHALAQIASDQLAGPRDATSPVQRARDYLLENFDQPVRVPELAARVGLSASHFAATFRRATGGGVLEYVKRIRMARARVLLVTSDLTVAEVAHAVGYEDPFYFSRQFRAVSGASPSQFRSASRAERVP